MLTLVVGSQGMRLKKIFTYVVREYMYVYKKERKRVFEWTSEKHEKTEAHESLDMGEDPMFSKSSSRRITEKD